jgi:type IV pilus assembly protein PilQ
MKNKPLIPITVSLIAFGVCALKVYAEEITLPPISLEGVAEVEESSQVIDVPSPVIEGAMIESVAETPAGSVERSEPRPTQRSGRPDMGESETISVDFPDEDVRTILRNVAGLFDLNLVIPDTLQGRTSLKLRNVTWPQVFEVVLDPLGFTHVADRNIIRIRSKAELAQEPVETRVYMINYARANELTTSIQPLIESAAGGRIQVDRRTNALVITERPSRMKQIEAIIERLDRANPQVMIQSKFVEVRLNDGKDVGMDWSTSLGPDGGTGFSIGSFASRFTGSSAVPMIVDEHSEGIVLVDGPLTRNPLDTAVFNAASFGTLLRALQTQSNVRLVSNPTVVTMDGEKAEIKITREFPQPDFTFNAQTGQRQFNGLGDPIDVGITLEVTPSVNNDGFISLDIFPEVSSTREDREIEGTRFPIRDVRTARTRITIKDGFTIALGGLVDRAMTEQESKVPVLGSLPALGRLFRNTSSINEETNLVIFITARTLNPDGSSYEEIIDPRQLERMKIDPTEVPGYQLSTEELELLQSLRQMRGEEASAERIARLIASRQAMEPEEVANDEVEESETVTGLPRNRRR